MFGEMYSVLIVFFLCEEPSKRAHLSICSRAVQGADTAFMGTSMRGHVPQPDKSPACSTKHNIAPQTADERKHLMQSMSATIL
jgi:hypothetical protein